MKARTRAPAPRSPGRSVDGASAAAGSLDAYMAQVRRVPLLDRDEEARLARRWRESRHPADAEKLVAANLRFVVKVALGYRRYGVPLPDLVQEGNIGLMRAVDRFDPDRGIRLISYGVWWIRAYIQACVLRSWSLVRVGTTHAQRRLFYRLPAASAALPADLRAGPGAVEALAESLSTTEDEVLVMQRRLGGRDLSLDARWDDDRAAPLLDGIADEAADPEREALDADDGRRRRLLLRGALDTLPARERAIVEQRHLLEDPRTLKEIGAELGLSRERVRQIESAALVKLRDALARRAA